MADEIDRVIGIRGKGGGGCSVDFVAILEMKLFFNEMCERGGREVGR